MWEEKNQLLCTSQIKDHLLCEHQFISPTLCQSCNRPLWGINCQGYCCHYCQQAFHRECTLNVEKCPKDRKSALLTKQKKPTNRNPSSPSRVDSIIERREGSLANDAYDPSHDGSDSTVGNILSINKASQDKNPTNLGRCASERLRPHERPVASKNRST
ncbi:unnamed protein product, partial [Didymodactylos carnosus]